MKKVYYLLLGVLLSFSITSCSVNDEYNTIPPNNGVDYSYVLQNFDLWEVDHSRTTGPANASVPFLDRAITLSFFDRVLYANNNFSGFGVTGNGFGIDVGTYTLGYNTVTIAHDVYGRYMLEIIYVYQDEIRLYDREQGLTYTLYGYYKNNYNYDAVFFNNIEYFLQEFKAWRKISTSGGACNIFDNENFLFFDTYGNIFYSSIDRANTSVDYLQWDYQGIYTIQNTNNFKRKLLNLNYGAQGVEQFELRSNRGSSTIDLYHLSSGTTYRFQGDGYIQFLRPKYKTINNDKK
jgi:hypothetical protein